jgi:hypothetical protein
VSYASSLFSRNSQIRRSPQALPFIHVKVGRGFPLDGIAERQRERQ